MKIQGSSDTSPKIVSSKPLVDVSGLRYILRFYTTGGVEPSLFMQVGPTREFDSVDEIKTFLNGLSDTVREAARITDSDGRHFRCDDLLKVL